MESALHALTGMDVLRHRVASTCGAGAGEKTGELSSRKSLMNCLCREAKVELKMKNTE